MLSCRDAMPVIDTPSSSVATPVMVSPNQSSLATTRRWRGAGLVAAARAHHQLALPGIVTSRVPHGTPQPPRPKPSRRETRTRLATAAHTYAQTLTALELTATRSSPNSTDTSARCDSQDTCDGIAYVTLGQFGSAMAKACAIRISATTR